MMKSARGSSSSKGPTRLSAGAATRGSGRTTSETADGRRQFKYDAAVTSNKRKPTRIDQRSEDDILSRDERSKLLSSTRDLKRNFAIAAWAIRRHLDFVADFTFHPNTHDRAFNQQFAKLMGAWSRRTNCDPARRHPLRRLMRISEACRVIDGDLLWVKLRRGQVQLVRGDRIQNQLGSVNSEEWKHGVRINGQNAAVEYAIHHRTTFGQMRFERNVPARNVIHHGYFDDPDQVRGVSPLTTAIMPFQDVSENITYALARAKLSQFMGLVIRRKAVDLDVPGGYMGVRGQDDEPADEDEDGEEDGRYDTVDFGPGPVQLELDPGDDAKWLESAMPSTQFQQFNLDVILIGLKALDLPFSFFREDFTNFFGSRGALQMYRRSCRPKQEDNRDVLEELTAWKLRSWIAEGRLVLPRGWTVDDVAFEWVARGIEWWDKAKEIQGDILAVQNGFDCPQRVCQDHGSGSYEDNIRQTAEALQMANNALGPLGMTVGYAIPAAGTVPVEAPADDAENGDQDEDGAKGPNDGETEADNAGRQGAGRPVPGSDRRMSVRGGGSRQRRPSNPRSGTLSASRDARGVGGDLPRL